MLSLETFLANPWLLYLTVTLVSLCIGSFLNVVILRLPKMMHQLPCLDIKQKQETVMLHVTCSSRKMGIQSC